LAEGKDVTGCTNHPLHFVRGELERDFGGGGNINGLSRRCTRAAGWEKMRHEWVWGEGLD
jgi:hypothetical protein